MNDPSSQPPDEGVWSRLRHRKVVQWGIAYVAAAWALLQGLEYLTDTFDWPEQLQRATTILLLIGLPVALVVAWYHGDRGQQKVTTVELAIVTLLCVVGGAVFWRYAHVSEAPSVASEAAQRASPATPLPPESGTPDAKSIAVLPFADMSAAKDQEYMSDGVAEELLNLLAKVPDLKVIARTSSFAFKGKDADIAEIARKLKVAHVLEGSVRTSGSRLRVTAQLIRASDSTQVWSDTYDRPLDDIFAIQDDIAAAVVEELKVKLLDETPTARKTNPEAYALYLQARASARQGTQAGLDESITLYERSLALDPTYADAWAGIGAVYFSQVQIYQRLPEEGHTLARTALSRALALDPQNAQAHAGLGWLAMEYDRDLDSTARHLERALAIEPVNAEIIDAAAVLSRRLGRLDQAIALGRFQTALDPGNPFGHANLGWAYRYAGRLEEALVEFRTAIRLSPGNLSVHESIGEVLLQQGDARAALEEMQLESSDATRLYGVALASYALGYEDESDAALSELIRNYEKTASCLIATVYAYRGALDDAFEWLDRASEYGDPDVVSMAIYPFVAKLHSDPRWLPFLRKNGIAPAQLAAIKFDVNVPN